MEHDRVDAMLQGILYGIGLCLWVMVIVAAFRWPA